MSAAATAVLEADVEEMVSRAVTRELRRRLRRLAAAYVVSVLLAVGLPLWASQNTRATERTDTSRLNAAVYGSCVRIQRVRSEANSFEGAIWEFLNVARAARLAAYRQQHQSLDLQTARAYLGITDSIHYQPQTDCQAAVRSPATYRAPRPIPYREALRRRLVSPPPVP